MKTKAGKIKQFFKTFFRNYSLKRKVHEIIFESQTFGGKLFDVILLLLIFISVIILMLESVDSYNNKYHELFFRIEWGLTILFTIEYLLRIYSTKKPIHYIFSFYGVIDLLSILPFYLNFLVEGSHYLLMLRTMRLMRIFRVFKLVRFMDERDLITYSLRASWRKISYFLFFIILTVCVIGTLMYLIEGTYPESGFDNIPISIYWCIVTLTTVGYGDISPVTPLGRFLASVIMILGYSIIAVPTGIVTAELAKPKEHKDKMNEEVCQYCSEENHLPHAEFCHRCGHKL
ncbi:ion transporter [Weeksellaceae bacterium TAE3-ERU29]|nr:ion transporter [Weeksellaceae bacterium TAE3-ERU29]